MWWQWTARGRTNPQISIDNDVGPGLGLAWAAAKSDRMSHTSVASNTVLCWFFSWCCSIISYFSFCWLCCVGSFCLYTLLLCWALESFVLCCSVALLGLNILMLCCVAQNLCCRNTGSDNNLSVWVTVSPRQTGGAASLSSWVALYCLLTTTYCTTNTLMAPAGINSTITPMTRTVSHLDNKDDPLVSLVVMTYGGGYWSFLIHWNLGRAL